MKNQKEEDPIMAMQIETVPQLNSLEEEDTEDYDRDVPDDDYMEHINREVNALNSKK